MLMYDTVTYKNANAKTRVNLIVCAYFQIPEGFEQNRKLLFFKLWPPLVLRFG